MELTGISAATGNQSTDKKNNQILGKDDFLKLLVTELENQDPLNPMEDREFIAQTAQFSTLEQLQEINKTLGEGINALASNQQDLLYFLSSWQSMQLVNNGANLVGKEIKGITSEGEDVTGIVDKVMFTEQGPVAVVSNKEVYLENIIEIKTVAENQETFEETAGEGNE